MFDWCCFPYPSEMWFFLYSSITLVFSFMLNKNCRTFQLLWQQNKFDGCFTICVSIYSLEHQSFHRGHSWLIYYTSQLNYWGQILQMQLNTKNYSCKQEWKSFRNDQWNMWKVKQLKLYIGDHHSFHLIRRCTNLFCNVQQTIIWILILHSVLYWLFTIIFIYIQTENVIWILLFTLKFLINVLYYVYTWLFYLKCQPPQRLSWSWLYGSWIYNSMPS
jgi:hypothetical protein